MRNCMNELPIYDTSLKLCVFAPCWLDGISTVFLSLQDDGAMSGLLSIDLYCIADIFWSFGST